MEKYKEKQPIAYQIIKNAIEKEKLSHAYMIETNGNINGLDFAKDFIKKIINNEEQNQNIENETYQDLKIIRPDGQWITKEQIEEIQKIFKTKSTINNKRIYVITDASKLNPSSANSLLKFLEEPEENIIAILLTENTHQVIETIISRCVIITLRQENSQSNSIIETIAKNIYRNKDEINKFIEDGQAIEKIEAIIKFVEYYEMNGSKTLCKTNKLILSNFKEKDEILAFFNMVQLFYKDIFNHKVKNKIEIYKENEKTIQKITDKNTVEQIIRKITIIEQTKEKLKYNANINLLLDKFIILLEEGAI